MSNSSALSTKFRDAVGARSGEVAVLLWSTAYYFLVLCAYYVLRPIRDEIGVANGTAKLPWLFTGTLAAMLLVHPLYTALVSRLTRQRFIAWAYRFFILNLVAFWLIFRAADPAQEVWAGRVFFIWTSVFNLFVVSVFWSLATDTFRPGQGKRLFGFVAVGGTLGAMLGATITTTLVGVLGPVNLLLVSALIIELGVRAAQAIDRHAPEMRAAADEAGDAAVARNDRGDEVIGGTVMEGIKRVFSSPYLLGIAFLILFYSLSSTFLYFQQTGILKSLYADDEIGRLARTRVLSMIDLATNATTLFAQLFVTGRVMKWLGVGFALAVLPVITLVGFAVLGFAPTLAVLIVFKVARSAGAYAVQRPAREVLFSVVPRTDKYKAKNFSDTFVYRVGDQVGAWSETALKAIGLGGAVLAFSMVPIATLWLALTVWLGRRYARMEGAQSSSSPRGATSAAAPSATPA